MSVEVGSKQRSRYWDVLVLAGVVFLAYGASLWGEFGGDDLILIQNARAASWSPADLARAFEWDQQDVTDGWLPPTFQTFRLQYFRPLIVASIKLDYTLWGTWPPGYFLSNMVLYLALTLIVYRWGADFGLDRRQCFLLALLFATYSVNQVAVNRINGRTELVAAVFVLGSVIALGRFYASRNPLHYALAFVSALLALAAKENSVMLPLLHGCAALFLYPPASESRLPGLKLRAWAIAPFFLMVPFYLLLRTAALDGFPIPPRGFYFHHPADPGFALFVLSKLAHAPIALVFQLPAQLFPVFLERSVPLLGFAAVASCATVILVLRWLKPPFRHFFVIWIALSLAPTLPMGYNSIYFFLCSPLIALLYVQWYTAAANVPRRLRAARLVVGTAVILGILVSAGGAVAVRNEGLPARNAARSIVSLLDEHPDVRRVYFIDVPPSCIYALMPAIRFEAPRHAAKSYATLGVTPDLAGAVPSTVAQQDPHTFELHPVESAYLRTGLEELLLQTHLPTFAPGMEAEHRDYEIEVVEVESAYIRDEGPAIAALRDHFDAPPAHQRGILRLRYRFEAPLASPDQLFIQLDGAEARALTFQ